MWVCGGLEKWKWYGGREVVVLRVVVWCGVVVVVVVVVA